MKEEKAVRISFEGSKQDQSLVKMLAAKKGQTLRELIMELVQVEAAKEGIK